MKKYRLLYRILFGFCCGALVSSPVLAVSSKTSSLADNTQVLVKTRSDVAAGERVGNTNLYKTTYKQAQSLAGDNDIFPLENYHPALTANDPQEPQSYLTIIGASTAWDVTTGDSSTVVAVIDGGFAFAHEDMVDRWYLNPGENGATVSEGDTPNCTSQALTLDKSCNNLDDDGNGYIDDWRGWDFAQADNDPSAGSTNPSADGVAHGVQVSGLIGITGNNSLGAASLNWQAKVMPLQVFTDDGAATTVEVAEAIAYALEQGVDVINLSLGSTGSDSVIESLLEQAAADGVVVVASAGNCGGSSYALNGCSFEGQTLYPATSTHTIAVAATDLNDDRAGFSSQGSALDIAAPGSGAIISSSYTETDDMSAYSSSLFGTSFSAPITSGLMSLLKDSWPAADPRELRAVLVDSAQKTTEMNGALFTTDHGYGRIQADAALALAQNCIPALDADLDCSGSVDIVDLSVFASQWDLQRTGRTDIDLSGKVDIVDLSIFASKWGL